MFDRISAREIAVSGLRAQRTRMNVIANNIANAQTLRTRETGEPFRRQLAIFRGEQIGPVVDPSMVGVKVSRIAEDPSPFSLTYNPSHPLANEDGYVAYPNVNIAVEMVDLVSAQRAYEANLAVIASSRSMSNKALELLQR
ncbi:MAG: flagellar basal-body rod protein FlgC [Candidatus Hydrogenedentota bacterium]